MIRDETLHKNVVANTTILHSSFVLKTVHPRPTVDSEAKTIKIPTVHFMFTCSSVHPFICSSVHS